MLVKTEASGLVPAAVPSPCFVLEMKALERNLAVIKRVRKEAGVKILLALKGFAMFRMFPEIRQAASGCTASSCHEARLAFEEFGGAVHAYAPVYLEPEWEEYSSYCSHITFNSLSQYEKYRDRLEGQSCGLRVNPEYSEVETDLYNPCVAGSRLGIRADKLGTDLPEGIKGLHCHNLCECRSTALEKTLANLERLFGRFLPQIEWLNLGGGHLMTAADYDVDHLISLLQAFKRKYPNLEIILEPGAAFAWQTGVLVATVLDLVEGGGLCTAMLDTSFAAHMPDCLEMPYTPKVRGAISPEKGEYVYRFGGCSCLAGDYVGEYGFDQPLKVGDRIVFEDMMHYTMVKTNMFNGINLPSIGIWSEDNTFELVKEFGYDDYRNRLS